MKLWDMMSMDLYQEMLTEKYIRVNQRGNLRIINYTESAQYNNMWNEVTKQSRGLVIDENWNVVARPFDKFLNYGQNPTDSTLMDYRVQVTDKMDGSLGIVFYHDQEWHVATRGSFDSDQALFAQGLLDTKRFGHLDTNWTYLVEIIYPTNRIVLDYGDTEDLVLLGARHKETGFVRLPNDVEEWQGTRTQSFSYKTLREALEAPQRPNAEGFVVYFPDLDYRLKIKQEDYVALHKIVTGLTKRRVWENMKEGKTLQELLDVIPDEWHDWTMRTYWDIDTDLRGLRHITEDYFTLLQLSLTTAEAENREWNRKDFAMAIKDHPHRGMLFLIFDGKGDKFREKSYDLVRPEAE